MGRPRPRLLPLLLAALVAGAAVALVLPGVVPVGAAAPDSASFTAVDNAWQVTGDRGATEVTIAVGGTVAFGYPSGRIAHNADFDGGPAPSSCTQTAGANSGPVPPLPANPTAAGWTGECRFASPGRYAFHCDLHPTLMRGTIVVVDESGTTPTGTTTTPTDTTPTQPPTRTTPTEPPGGGGGGTGGGGGAGGTGPTLGEGLPRLARGRVTVARRQRGAVLRGTVTTPVAGTRIVVAAFASNRALVQPRPRRARLLRVGATRTRSDGEEAAFALRLDGTARAALRRRGSLAVELRIVVTPPGGRARSTALTVVVRPALPLSRGY